MATRRIEIPALTDAEIARFWNSVAIGDNDACWLWKGSTSRTNQYGAFWVSRAGKSYCIGPHCVAWILKHGAIPLGLLVRHKCDVQRCCNPFHLILGNDNDNKGDSIKRGRHKHLLSNEQVLAIRRAWPSRSQTHIALEFGIDQSVVSEIVNFKIYKHVEDQSG